MITLSLPLLSTLLAACSSSTPTPPPPTPPPAPEKPHTLAFDPLPLTPDLERTTAPIATTRATIDGAPQDIALTILGRSGTDGFGARRKRDGTPYDGKACHDQDFNSLLWAHDRPFLVSHFECVPGETVVTPLDQAPDGTLSPAGRVPVDFGPLGGVWFPCAGQASAWGTHLGSEEYEPNARVLAGATFDPKDDPYGAWASMLAYWPDPGEASPYLYGWITEIAITDATGAATAAKHGAMGRFSHEIAYVVGDDRTAYLSDDGRAVGWFMFVADAKGDLTAGHLYAARFSARAPDGLDIAWIPLGHATDAEIRALIDAGVRFADLFEVRDPDPAGACPDGFAWTAHAYGAECLKLAAPSDRVPDPAKAASRLETRRYAAMLGATTELEKGEGVTWDPQTGTVYLAISKIGGRMLQEPDAPVDAIALPENPCGAVYGGPTSPDIEDSAGAPIPSKHVLTHLAPVLAGRPLEAPDAANNFCDPGAIANPDNLTFAADYGLLLVAEDTPAHRNNVLWAHDVRTDALTRVLAAPRGGEVTGIHWIPDLDGFAYLTLAIQHPWRLGRDVAVPDFVTEDDLRSFTGVLGPFSLGGR